ncbi:DUF4296 domain-containing protein [Flavihumibacter sp. ZG627]|uniref:DUF4296 domain-containing protein n=1 Tax=Flavihumibacter sp. ZG627 TaxID=1463156 RepID=UPI00057EA365|nr:DUF4296 domain-containing protein [Flavihumibacter sp. ZG627]KIC89389.1 hypothetical protein HY58_17410 [Flavihumibacter sp. ZG627]
MRNACVLVILTIFFLNACKEKREEQIVLSNKQIVPIVYDLMLTDEFTMQMKGKDTTYDLSVNRSEKYDQVFRLHKIDFKTFSDSYKYYLGHPGELKVVFDSVEALATRRRLQIMNPSKSLPDSAARAIELN